MSVAGDVPGGTLVRTLERYAGNGSGKSKNCKGFKKAVKWLQVNSRRKCCRRNAAVWIRGGCLGIICRGKNVTIA